MENLKQNEIGASLESPVDEPRMGVGMVLFWLTITSLILGIVGMFLGALGWLIYSVLFITPLLAIVSLIALIVEARKSGSRENTNIIPVVVLLGLLLCIFMIYWNLRGLQVG
jgi:4-hydroxybenzoate polyprenyltransferase